MAAIIEKSSVTSLMTRLMGKPAYVPAGIFKSAARITPADREALKKAGLTQNELSQILAEQLVVNFDRHSIYRECDRAVAHWLMGGAMQLYADVATAYSRLHNSSVWVTSENEEYEKELNGLLERLGTEEKVYDWAWTTGSYGDHFVEVKTHPTHGVIAIDDNTHPIAISRADKDGRLLGFFDTPLGYNVEERQLKPPWQYVHFRILGTKKRRPLYGDPAYCLRGNTEIVLLDGTRPTIKEMAEQREKYIGKTAWSINPAIGELEFDYITEVKKTRVNAELVRVYLDNDKYIDCTPDHRIMLRDGSFKEAQHLQAGESLMPLYQHKRKGNKQYYTFVYDPATQEFRAEHKVVIEQVIGRKLNDNEVTHHKNFKGRNNEPGNLKAMIREDHVALHTALANLWDDPEYRNKTLARQKESASSPEMKEASRKTLNRQWANPEFRAKMLAVLERARRVPRKTMAAHPDKCVCASCMSRKGQRPAHKEGCACGVCLQKVYLNHKVLRVERLAEREDTYDLTMAKNHNFPVGAGVFVHNSEYRSINIMAPETRRISSQYGSSLMTQALPSYKRLRMTEDCILMARVSKGVLRYLYKLKVDGSNQEQISELIEDIATTLKRARALDTSSKSSHYDEKDNSFSVMEDIVMPVWGDAKNDLIVEKLGGECLRGDVKIRLMDGTDHEIKEMADNREKYIGKDIYACTKDGAVVARRINNVLMTRPQTNFVRVHLDSGEHFDVTPDHPCMLRDGTFKMAELLQPSESLMPLYLRKSESKKTFGYEEVYMPSTGKYKLTHRVVAEDLLRSERESKHKALILTGIDSGLVTHHKDLNKYNNDSSNLQWMGRHEHWLYHASLIQVLNVQREGKTYEEMYGLEKSEYIKEKIGAGSTATNNRRWAMLSKQARLGWWNRTTRLNRKEIKHKAGCGCNWCKATCGELKTFDEVSNKTCQCCGETFYDIKAAAFANHVRWNCTGREKVPHKKDTSVYLNHKVTRVEKLDVIEDAYDLVIEGAYDKNGGPEHCFALSCGVFVHNTDIRWITDLTEQRNQTAAALSVPLQMMGAYMNDMPNNSGSPSLEQLDIRFARSARRLQRSQINGYKRICQIHLAITGKDPNPSLFEVHMSETSSAEETELMEGLDKGTDIVDKMADLFEKFIGDRLEKVELLDYLNQKILKLNDLDIHNLIKNVGEAPAGQEAEAIKTGLTKLKDKIEKRKGESKKWAKPRVENTDLFAHTPGDKAAYNSMNESHWNANYKDCKISVTPEKYDKDGKLLPAGGTK